MVRRSERIGDRRGEEEQWHNELHGEHNEALLERKGLLQRRAALGHVGADRVTVDVVRELEFFVETEVNLLDNYLLLRLLLDLAVFVGRCGSFFVAGFARLIVILIFPSFSVETICDFFSIRLFLFWFCLISDTLVKKSGLHARYLSILFIFGIRSFLRFLVFEETLELANILRLDLRPSFLQLTLLHLEECKDIF